MIIIPELSECAFRIFAFFDYILVFIFSVPVGSVGDLSAEAVFFIEFLSYDLNDVISVTVCLCEYESLGNFKITVFIKSVFEYIRKIFFE